MIKIKAFYGEWKEVTKKQAKEFVENMMQGITTMNEQEKMDHINKKHLQGITVQELLRIGG